MSAGIVAALEELLVDVRSRGCDASRLGELQQIANLAGQVVREGALAAQREEHWAREGFTSPGVWVAAHTGLPRSQASGLLREAAALEHMPHSRAAAQAGALCGADIRLLTDCQREDSARYDEQIDATLVALAGTRDLANAVRHWKACANAVNSPDPALQPEPPPQEPEWLRLTELLDGRGRIEGELNAENFVIVQAAIDKGIAGYLNNRRNGDETSPARRSTNSEPKRWWISPTSDYETGPGTSPVTIGIGWWWSYDLNRQLEGRGEPTLPAVLVPQRWPSHFASRVRSQM
ncbi:MAG: hypothetical protein ACKV2O_21480 [Acidimicrobiales bacterium]